MLMLKNIAKLTSKIPAVIASQRIIIFNSLINKNCIKNFFSTYSQNSPRKYNNANKSSGNKEYSSSGNIILRNDNLKFNSSNFDILFYPFHPEIVKKTATTY
jgi:hypothetical protein